MAGIVPFNVMAMSPPSERVHPVRVIAAEVVLNSSIHSSFALAAVPPHAISLMTTARAGKGVRVSVLVEVEVGVLVGVEVLVAVDVGVDVDVGVFVAVAVGVLVAGEEQGESVEAELRGLGAAVEKSAELLSLSVQLFPPRRIAVVLLGAGAREPS